jgi:hypothetical protein
LDRNGARLITNKRCLKKMNSNIVHICFEHLQKDSQNIIYLHQVLNIENLQVMEPKKKKKLTTWFIMLFLWFSQIQNYNCKHCLHIMWLFLFCLHLGANEQNEFVHADLCKSLSHESIWKSNYFSTFIDDFSHIKRSW